MSTQSQIDSINTQVDTDINNKTLPSSITKVNVGNNIKAVAALTLDNYKKLSFLISQSGTSNPVITIQENTTGGTFTATRDSVGNYNITATGGNIFTVGKTGLLSTLAGSFASGKLKHEFIGATLLVLNTYNDNGTTLTDGVMTDTYIEIKIYP